MMIPKAFIATAASMSSRTGFVTKSPTRLFSDVVEDKGVSLASFEENTVAWIEGLNSETCGDVEWHKQYFCDDASLNWDFKADPKTTTNVEEIAAGHAGWWSIDPDLKVSVVDIISNSDGDRVGVQIKAVFPNKDVPSIELAGVFNSRDGKHLSGTWFGDYSYILRELGVYDPCS